MGTDHQITYLLTRFAWALPVVLTVLTIGVVTVVRRDAGLWWKLVLGGVAALVVGQTVSAVGLSVLSLIDEGYRYGLVVSVPAVLLQVLGLALLGAGAITGRRGQAESR